MCLSGEGEAETTPAAGRPTNVSGPPWPSPEIRLYTQSYFFSVGPFHGRKDINSRIRASNVDLAAVLDRLQHLEDSISHPSPHQTSSSYTPTNAGSLPSFDHSIRHAFSPISSDRTRPAIWSPPEPVSVSGLDVTSTLKDAVDQVQKIRLRGIAHDTVSEEVSIPPVLAKRWIQSMTLPFTPATPSTGL